ncbi:Hsp20/alpha crystallin family protein [Microbacterium sp. EYE_5]|uniref:Hsp20/alpha crystallin family protein n=1 Tax=unclassified Microbacterium TaxID=2609290 RepID=UPI00200630AA|nr:MULTISPECIES: Hsp20/alpha crystallin family protein [unclassified Microbacterium]MCK6080042.1 Hsp20/alpha crystallin family protein [Microbacterium sp. EYE_382]MCK6085313.1 Hsp20/alpha crystallin family protein [Microbacterium sp. EYE_384]MCK6122462.1 Hsp20/alpha crystallin family protein [Microbacterium sp. EYE_80]MCK6126076.1 Hsp20/alpha crystallin family protein [Microbacterium sp. EYE_79]MCK6140997.1 Hsp20/alpha crystallin family protein [Microbacterium sp. EYE_39]
MATYDPFRDIDRLASTLFDTRRGPRRMPMDLYRDGDHYVLTADLPGIDPGSVDIDVDGQLLTIRAERTLASGDGVKWITREREAASFLRQLNLGQGIDTEAITATYDNGVLSVTIPVSEKAKPRKVAVQAAGSSRTIAASESDEPQPIDQ